ncbi:hypothetical protein GGR54DRAFT_643956 [Hypoxylon sp. NC1633]|nr:hypothetical protein GGR54DRAFT_643956 [Hypoxylon sp. NC1633]
MPLSTENPAGIVATRARKIYRAVGFSKWYNFWMWFVFGGSFLAFSLVTMRYLDLYGYFCGSTTGGSPAAPPGQCFYYLQPGRYQVGIILHLACILPASVLAIAQFTPIVRRKAMQFHRINGWVIVVLSVPGTLSALAIARRSMGGGPDVQSMVGVLAIMFFTALGLGCIHAKRHRIAEHRAWMLRAWVYGGAIVTMRPIVVTAALILSLVGGYYSAQPCAKIDFMLGSKDATLAAYPDCASFFSGEDPDHHVAVPANVLNGDEVEIASVVNLVFGMAGWVSIFLHAVCVELYLHYTSVEGRKTSRPQPANGASSVGASGDSLKKVN